MGRGSPKERNRTAAADPEAEQELVRLNPRDPAAARDPLEVSALSDADVWCPLDMESFHAQEPAEHSSGMEEASRSGAASDSQQSSSSESSVSPCTADG
jgi:hypothetical protein